MGVMLCMLVGLVAGELDRLRRGRRSDNSRSDGLADPWDYLVEHLLQRGCCLEAQDLLGLIGGGHAALDVVGERIVVNYPQLWARTLDLAPDQPGQLEDGAALGGGEVEVLVAGLWIGHRCHYPAGQVTAVGVGFTAAWREQSARAAGPAGQTPGGA